MELDDVKKRLIAAMDLPAELEDKWLDEAERRLEAHRFHQQRRRVYDVSTVGARIRTAREVVGLTQKMLGRVVGVCGGHISHFETGTVPMKPEHLERIARSLKVSAKWLLMETDEGGPPIPDKVKRKQTRVNWHKMHLHEKKKVFAQAELNRMRGLTRPKAPAAATCPPTAAPPPSADTARRS